MEIVRTQTSRWRAWAVAVLLIAIGLMHFLFVRSVVRSGSPIFHYVWLGALFFLACCILYLETTKKNKIKLPFVKELGVLKILASFAVLSAGMIGLFVYQISHSIDGFHAFGYEIMASVGGFFIQALSIFFGGLFLKTRYEVPRLWINAIITMLIVAPIVTFIWP
jgi:hypothetical protein